MSVSSDSVFIDLGLKTEGILPLSEFQNDAAVKPGDKLQVTIKGRDPGGYYLLTRSKAARPTDWAALERAFADKTAIVGTVTGVVKGGLSVDIGVRAFMPASRSGVRDAAEMENLVEQEMKGKEPGDFVYADPPYDVEFTQYAKDGFGWDDQERTAVWLSRHRGPVVLVNQATDRVEKLYRRLGSEVTIRMTADCAPRISPPSSSAASIAAINRSTSRPVLFSNASAMASQTVGFSMVFA